MYDNSELRLMSDISDSALRAATAPRLEAHK